MKAMLAGDQSERTCATLKRSNGPRWQGHLGRENSKHRDRGENVRVR